MIAPELTRRTADARWPAEDSRRRDADLLGDSLGAASGRSPAYSFRSRIDRAAAWYPWAVVTAAVIVGITAGWLAKRR